jgi:hypothetical protein
VRCCILITQVCYSPSSSSPATRYPDEATALAGLTEFTTDLQALLAKVDQTLEDNHCNFQETA